MKKIRLWVCRKCGRAWNRKKIEKYPSLKCCNEYVSSARKFPQRRKSHYERVQEKIARFKQSYQTKPRTSIGTVLKVSPETREAFKGLRKAKQKPAFLKRANLFIQLIAKDVRLYQTERDSEKHWCRSINKEGKISKSKGALNSLPVVLFDESMYSGLHGEYRKSLLQSRHDIRINPNRSNFLEFQKTFLHEVLHWIDGQCAMDCEGHDYYWQKRLNRLQKMFRVKD